MNNQIFKGAGVAIVTPMNEDSSINYDMLGKIIDNQIENNTDAIVICGTTGESSTMTDDEHIKTIEFAVKHTNKRIPVIAGAGSNDTAYAIELSKEAKSIGVDGLLQVTPYYNKCSQRGLVSHFTQIADATDLPIILYNVPSRTGVTISADTYKILSEHKNIVATKEATGNLSLVAETRSLCGDNLDIYTGNDDQIVPILSMGGIGAISVISNIMPKETHDICQLYFDGKVKESSALQIKMIPIINAMFMDVNPIPVKQAFNLMGTNVGDCRMPLIPMEAEQIAKLKAIMQNYNLIK